MSENSIAKMLKGIGAGFIVVGIIIFVILGLIMENFVIMIVGAVGSAISGLIFEGFGEIIDLLQQNVDKQDKIIKKLNGNTSDTSVLKDIEDNLPSI